MSYIQKFFTSRDNNANAETYVGQEGRLWWDPVTNQIYSSNGNTPGGTPLSGSGGIPGGSNSQVQFNNNDTFGGSAFLTFDIATGALNATGNITGGNIISIAAISTVSITTTGDAAIAGNLTVNGNTTYNNVTSFDVEDPIISLGRGANNTQLISNDGKDRGEQLWYYSTNERSAFVGYQTSSGNIIAATDVSITNEVVTVNSYGTFVVGNMAGTTVSVTGNVTGGNVNTLGVVIATGNVVGNNLNAAGLSLSSNVVSALNVTANIAGGNITTPGLISAAGNISTTGNVFGNYYIGNGSLLTGISVSSNRIFNGTSNVEIATVNGNITITAAAGNSWTFDTSGALTLPGATAGENIATQIGYITVGNLLIGQGGALFNSNNDSWALYGNLSDPGTTIFLPSNADAGNGLALYFENQISNVEIRSGGTWVFDTVGNLTLPGNLTTTANITGNYILGNGSQLTGIDATSIQNGTSNVRVTSSGGNVTVGVGGTSNIAVFATTGVSVTANITSGNVNTNTLVGTGTTIKSTGDLNFSATGNITVNSTYINNLADPVQNQDAATKYYVDSVAQGLHVHDSANLATTQDLATYTGATVTYSNGTSGVGATLSFVGNTLSTLDGTVIPALARLLIKNQANAVTNGMYVYTSSSLLTRAADFDTTAEAAGGDFLFVTTGATLADTGWVQTTDNPIIGTSPLVFSQFSGAGTYTANTAAGLVLSGSVFNAKTDGTTTAFDGGGNIIVKASAALTTPNIGAATGTSISVTGAITGAGMTGTSLTVSTGNVTLGNIVNAGANLTGNVGSATSYFNTLFAKATSAQYADVAEQYLADADYPPGTVLIFGGEQEVTADIVSHSTAIAGVVSENPSYLMNSGLQGQHVVSVALLGRVPCQVQGTIRKGDLLVASNRTGVAQRLDPARYQPGCIIGKSLETFNSDTVGQIEIAVGIK